MNEQRRGWLKAAGVLGAALVAGLLKPVAALAAAWNKDAFAAPAFSAGPPFSTLTITAPLAASSLNDCASSLVSGWMPMPTRPRVTLPWLCSCLATSSATSIGIANDTPM